MVHRQLNLTKDVSCFFSSLLLLLWRGAICLFSLIPFTRCHSGLFPKLDQFPSHWFFSLALSLFVFVKNLFCPMSVSVLKCHRTESQRAKWDQQRKRRTESGRPRSSPDLIDSLDAPGPDRTAYGPCSSHVQWGAQNGASGVISVGEWIMSSPVKWLPAL